MEGRLMKKQICAPSAAALALHRINSHTISKSAKPKIRIIHIFAPEIIKTDAANFRELVQRLTGKPTNDDDQMVVPAPAPNKVQVVERIKGEQEIWKGANSASGGGFLGGFPEFEQCGFMQELNHFPFFQGITTTATLMDGDGDGDGDSHATLLN